MSRDFSTVVDDFASDGKPPSAPSIHFDFKRFITLRLPAIFLIGAVMGVPLGLAGWFLTPVEFLASAQIQYRSIGAGIVDRDDGRGAAGDYDKFVNTEMAKVTGDNVLLQVLQRPEILALPTIQREPDKLTFLKNRISARLLQRSELVDVTCRMETRQEALQVLRVVIEIYERQALSDEQKEGSAKIDILQEKIDSKEKDLAIQRQKIQDMEGALGTTSGSVLPQDSVEAEQYREAMLNSEAQLKDAENNVTTVQEKIERILVHQQENQSNPANPIYEFGVESLVGEDPRVSSLQAEMVQVESNVALLRESHQEGHPKLRAQVKQLESMQRNIERQSNVVRADVLKTLHGQFVEELDAAKRMVADEQLILKQNTDRYNSYVDGEKNKASLASADRARLQQLREQATLDSGILSDWRKEVQNMQLEEEAPARVRIATDPFAPFTQGIAKKLLMAMAGIVAAFAVGMAYGVIRELLDNQIRTPRDLARISSLPIIASIPHMSEDRLSHGGDSALLMAQHPNSVIADEYRRILARILFPEDNAAEISSLLVVSARPGEGKTTLACNLAVALVRANRSVLLIDLSSQRPCVERTFGLEPAAGLADLLESDEPHEEFIRRTAFEDLGVLGPGAHPEELAGRLASREMMDFMEWADEHFDHIIVDSPPLLLMSDAKLLAPAIDGVLCVVGVGRSTLGMVNRCLRELGMLRANTVGIVLNGIRSIRGGYMKQNQSLFYAYGDRGDMPARDTSIPQMNILDEEAPETLDAEVVLLPFDEREK